MRHDAGVASPEHAELVVRVAVEFGPWAELSHPVDLTEVFRQMALHGKVVFHAQAGKGVHEIIRTRRNKARR